MISLLTKNQFICFSVCTFILYFCSFVCLYLSLICLFVYLSLYLSIYIYNLYFSILYLSIYIYPLRSCMRSVTPCQGSLCARSATSGSPSSQSSWNISGKRKKIDTCILSAHVIELLLLDFTLNWHGIFVFIWKHSVS